MTAEEFHGHMAAIEKFYSRPIPREAKVRAWDQIRALPGKALFRSLDRLMMEHTGHMPPLQKIVDLTQEEGRRIAAEKARQRETEAHREKEEFRQGQAKAFKDGSKIARATLMIVSAMIQRKITRGRVLEEINALDSAFPDAGFREHTKGMRALYKDRGLPMDRVCGTTGGVE